MLQSLHVKNLALIDEIEIEFQSGLNILTGETGAGKSIILGSIQLALGGRYSADLLRKDCDYGFVELVFIVEKEKQLDELKELDIYPEEGLVILNRKLMDGRSISKINGETVTMNLLKKVATILIDIHGQHEHQTLLQVKNHLAILDEYIGEESLNLREENKKLYKEYKSLMAELEENSLDEESRKRELSFLEFEAKEIDEANLQANEDDELEVTYRKMVNAKKILEQLEEAYLHSCERRDGNASEAISRSLHAVQSIKQYDDYIENLYEQLNEIDTLLNDFNRELAGYKDEMVFSEEEYQEVESRLNLWNHLKSKYGQGYEEIIQYHQEVLGKIEKLQDYETYLNHLDSKIEEKRIRLEDKAKELSASRMKHAKLLGEEIKSQLQDMNFLDIQFEVRVEPTEEIKQDGCDKVTFMVSMNPGEEVKSISNVASGGELSRIMLAIKTVLADREQIETAIFDEVDAGISGKTATKVGEKLALIAKSRQVICITHLAQIAALAKQHFIIEKNVKNGKTITEINLLNEKESIEELTRILGGGVISEALTKSAIEMKELAK